MNRSERLLFLTGPALVAVGVFLIVLALTHQKIYGSFYAPGNAAEYRVDYPPLSAWSSLHISLFIGLGAGIALAGLGFLACGLIGFTRRAR